MKKLQLLPRNKQEKKRRILTRARAAKYTHLSDLINCGILEVGETITLKGQTGVVCREGWIEYGDTRYPGAWTWCKAIKENAGVSLSIPMDDSLNTQSEEQLGWKETIIGSKGKPLDRYKALFEREEEFRQRLQSHRFKLMQQKRIIQKRREQQRRGIPNSQIDEDLDNLQPPSPLPSNMDAHLYDSSFESSLGESEDFDPIPPPKSRKKSTSPKRTKKSPPKKKKNEPQRDFSRWTPIAKGGGRAPKPPAAPTATTTPQQRIVEMEPIPIPDSEDSFFSFSEPQNPENESSLNSLVQNLVYLADGTEPQLDPTEFPDLLPPTPITSKGTPPNRLDPTEYTDASSPSKKKESQEWIPRRSPAKRTPPSRLTPPSSENSPGIPNNADEIMQEAVPSSDVPSPHTSSSPAHETDPALSPVEIPESEVLLPDSLNERTQVLPEPPSSPRSSPKSSQKSNSSQNSSQNSSRNSSPVSPITSSQLSPSPSSSGGQAQPSSPPSGKSVHEAIEIESETPTPTPNQLHPIEIQDSAEMDIINEPEDLYREDTVCSLPTSLPDILPDSESQESDPVRSTSAPESHTEAQYQEHEVFVLPSQPAPVSHQTEKQQQELQQPITSLSAKWNKRKQYQKRLAQQANKQTPPPTEQTPPCSPLTLSAQPPLQEDPTTSQTVPCVSQGSPVHVLLDSPPCELVPSPQPAAPFKTLAQQWKERKQTDTLSSQESSEESPVAPHSSPSSNSSQEQNRPMTLAEELQQLESLEQDSQRKIAEEKQREQNQRTKAALEEQERLRKREEEKRQLEEKLQQEREIQRRKVLQQQEKEQRKKQQEEQRLQKERELEEKLQQAERERIAQEEARKALLARKQKQEQEAAELKRMAEEKRKQEENERAQREWEEQQRQELARKRAHAAQLEIQRVEEEKREIEARKKREAEKRTREEQEQAERERIEKERMETQRKQREEQARRKQIEEDKRQFEEQQRIEKELAQERQRKELLEKQQAEARQRKELQERQEQEKRQAEERQRKELLARQEQEKRQAEERQRKELLARQEEEKRQAEERQRKELQEKQMQQRQRKETAKSKGSPNIGSFIGTQAENVISLCHQKQRELETEAGISPVSSQIEVTLKERQAKERQQQEEERQQQEEQLSQKLDQILSNSNSYSSQDSFMSDAAMSDTKTAKGINSTARSSGSEIMESPFYEMAQLGTSQTSINSDATKGEQDEDEDSPMPDAEESDENGEYIRNRNSSPVILASGLSSFMLQRIQILVNELGGRMVSAFSDDVTHLVVLPLPKNPKCTRRTLKYTQAILAGTWIVSYDWVLQSFHSRSWVDEAQYQMRGDDTYAKGIPQKARKVAAKGLPRLFHGKQFYFCGKFEAIDKDILRKVITAGHGKMYFALPKAPKTTTEELQSANKHNRIVVCDGTTFDYEAAKNVYFTSGLIPVSYEYLFDCVSQLNILPQNSYQILQTQTEVFQSQCSQAF